MKKLFSLFHSKDYDVFGLCIAAVVVLLGIIYLPIILSVILWVILVIFQIAIFIFVTIFGFTLLLFTVLIIAERIDHYRTKKNGKRKK